MATGHYNNPPAIPAKPISQELGQKLDQVAQERGISRRQLLWLLGGGAAVVSVAGVAGGVALSNSVNNSTRGAVTGVLNPSENENESPSNITEVSTEGDAVNETTNPADFYDNYEVSADGNVVYLDPVGGKDGTHGRGLRGTHSFIDRKEMERRVAEWQKIFEQPKMKNVIEAWNEVTGPTEAKTRNPIVEYFLYSNRANVRTPEGFPDSGVNSKDKTGTLIIRELEDLKSGERVPQAFLNQYLVLMRASVGKENDPFAIVESKLIPKEPEKLGEMIKYWQSLDLTDSLAKR